MNLAPIALFVYKRPDHSKRTLSALKNNLLAKQTDLFIFSDAPKKDSDIAAVNKVRKLIKSVKGFKSVKVIKRKQNLGLANSIIDGVTYLTNKYGRVIVVEDDLLTSKYFLNFMNDSLDLYSDDKKVASIHAYVFPIDSTLPDTFFIRGADCWGWATWKRAWKLFEPNGPKLLSELKKRNLINRFDYGGYANFSEMLKNQIDGKNDSWAIRWHAAIFLREMLTLYPGKSLVFNIGNDASGTHTDDTSEFDVLLNNAPVEVKKIESIESKFAYLEFKKFFKKRVKNPLHFLKIFIGRLIG